MLAVRPAPGRVAKTDGMTGESTEALYRTYAPLIARRCRALLGDEQAALDATHDVFLKVCAALPGFRGSAALSTWIYRVATNHCLNRLRKARNRGRVLRLLAREPRPAPTPAPYGAAARRALLEDLLGHLSPDEVQLLVHRFCDDMTQAEIAEVLGVTERTVRNRLERALDQLRARAIALDALEVRV